VHIKVGARQWRARKGGYDDVASKRNKIVLALIEICRNMIRRAKKSTAFLSELLASSLLFVA
jgi:hypothetical protein